MVMRYRLRGTSTLLQLDAVGVELPPMEGEHPNRQPFTGILTRVDEPSDRPPHGARGHRVFISREVAERALPSLIGMAVDVAGDLTDHTVKKIGLITEARLEGRDMRVSGYLYAKDFPDDVARLQARKAHLGMSYEITNVQVEDEEADIWTLRDLTFTGAAILERGKAAYERTSVYARAAREEETVKRNVLEALKGLQTSLKAATAAMGTNHDDEEGKRKEEDEEARRGRRDDEEAKRKEEDEEARRGRRDDEEGKRKEEDAKGYRGM